MRSKVIRFALVFCVALAAAAVLATPARAAGNCTTLAGTITGWFDFAGPQGPAWYGVAYLKFGKDPTVTIARLVDSNDGYKEHPYKSNFAGDEILTFTVDGVGSFQMAGHFICIAGTTPNFIGFSEEGKLVPEAGTGPYAGMTGNISSHGSASGNFSAFPTPEQPWLWITQMTGSVCAAK